MCIVGGDADVREVLHHPEVFTSGHRRRADRPDPAAHPAADRPARAPATTASCSTRSSPRSASPCSRTAPARWCRTWSARWPTTGTATSTTPIAEPLPTTVFLQLLGLPARPGQGVHRPQGRHRPPAGAHATRSGSAMVNETGQQIYAVLQEVVDQRLDERAGRLHLAVPRLRGRRPPPHPRGRHRHRLPVLPRRARHRHRVARLHARLPRPAPRAAPAARRRPVAHPPRRRGDAALGDAGAGRDPHHHRRTPSSTAARSRRAEPVSVHARLGQHRRAHLGAARRGRLPPRGEQAHRLRRRRPPLPRVAPGPHGAARRPRGVAPRRPRLPPARRASSSATPKDCGPSTTWS